MLCAPLDWSKTVKPAKISVRESKCYQGISLNQWKDQVTSATTYEIRMLGLEKNRKN